MTTTPLSPLQVDMDPVRLAVACMAMSMENAALRAELAALRQALQIETGKEAAQ